MDKKMRVQNCHEKGQKKACSHNKRMQLLLDLTKNAKGLQRHGIKGLDLGHWQLSFSPPLQSAREGFCRKDVFWLEDFTAGALPFMHSWHPTS